MSYTKHPSVLTNSLRLHKILSPFFLEQKESSIFSLLSKELKIIEGDIESSFSQRDLENLLNIRIRLYSLMSFIGEYKWEEIYVYVEELLHLIDDYLTHKEPKNIILSRKDDRLYDRLDDISKTTLDEIENEIDYIIENWLWDDSDTIDMTLRDIERYYEKIVALKLFIWNNDSYLSLRLSHILELCNNILPYKALINKPEGYEDISISTFEDFIINYDEYYIWPENIAATKSYIIEMITYIKSINDNLKVRNPLLDRLMLAWETLLSSLD